MSAPEMAAVVDTTLDSWTSSDGSKGWAQLRFEAYALASATGLSKGGSRVCALCLPKLS